MKQTDGSTQSPNSETKAARAPYIAPSLRVYGNVAALTHNVGMTATAQSDGNAHGKTKTH